MDDEERGATTDDRCPVCATGDPYEIAYGMPSHDFAQNAERLGFALGGCIVSEENPKWECRACGNRW